jgi:hypothetical protein
MILRGRVDKNQFIEKLSCPQHPQISIKNQSNEIGLAGTEMGPGIRISRFSLGMAGKSSCQNVMLQ